MPVGRIQHRNEIGLGDHVFRIKGGVTRRPVNEFAEKTVIGAYTEDSDPILSVVTWRDFSGGQGRFLFDVNKPEHVTQFWTGNVNNDIPGHIVPHQSLSSADAYVASSGTSGLALDSTQVVVDRVAYKSTADSAVFVYAVATDGGSSHRLGKFTGNDAYEWQANLHSRPLDIATGRVNGIRSLSIAEASAVQWAYETGGTSAGLFTDSTHVMKSLTYWRGLLWGVNNSGELAFSGENTSTSTLNWVDVARAEITDSKTVTKLVTARMALPGKDDLEHLVLIRNDGFDIYNRLTEEFDPALRLPASSAAGKGGIEWNGAFYYPYGLSLWQWTPGQARDVGLTANEGVPEERAGVIYDVAASPRQLFVTVEPTNSTDQVRAYTRTGTTGWVEFAAPIDVAGSRVPLTSPMYVGLWPPNDYALMAGWSFNFVQPYREMPYLLSLGEHSIITDSGISNLKFRAGNNEATGQATVISPWVVADGNQDWTALKFSIDVSDVRSSVAVGVPFSSFALDYGTEFNDSLWTNLISLNNVSASSSTPAPIQEGIFEVRLPNATEPVGEPFTSIRWRARWGVANNNVYDLHRVSLVFQKRPKLRYAFSFEIDFTDDVQGYSPKEQREFLDEFLMQTTLAPFTYHDEHPGGAQTYYVRALQPAASEKTGNPESGTMVMTVLEVV